MKGRSQLHREVRLIRFLDLVASALLGIAFWSIIGAIVALRQDAPDLAMDFFYSLVGAGVTLIAIGIFEERLDA